MKNQKGSATVWIIVILVVVIVAGAAYWYWMQSRGAPTTSATEIQTSQETTNEPNQAVNRPSQTTQSVTAPQTQQSNSNTPATKASSGSADTLTSTTASGIASGGNVVDIYIYGPNNGNIGVNGEPEPATQLIGPLVFSEMNVPVVNGRWSVTISPALSQTSVSDYYQINVGQPISFSETSPYSFSGTTMNADGTDYDVLNIK